MKNTLKTGLIAMIVATSMVACTPKEAETTVAADSTATETVVADSTATVSDSTATVAADSAANTAK